MNPIDDIAKRSVDAQIKAAEYCAWLKVALMLMKVSNDTYLQNMADFIREECKEPL
jgi:hypothetical protein